MSTPRTIRLADLSPGPIIVELGEHAYELQSVTRSVQQKLMKALAALNKAEEQADNDPDAAMIAMAGCLDVLLAPRENVPPAKKVIVDAWKNDQLSAPQILRLFESLREEASSRPT